MPFEQEPTAESTYSIEYKRDTFLPPIKFHQLPSLTLKDVAPTLPPRQFPIEPIGPKRRFEKELEDCGPSLGLGTKRLPTFKYLDSKPIVRTLPPQEIVNEVPVNIHKLKISPSDIRLASKLDKAKIETLSHSFKWTTTTRQLMKEVTMSVTKLSPPKTTLELNADVIKYRPIRFEASPDDWQKVAPVWDKLQNRFPTECTEKPCQCKNNDDNVNKNSINISVNDGIRELVRTGKLSSHFVRPCPGYAGFVPRSQVEAPIKQNCVDLRTSSTQRASYRPIPPDVYYPNKEYAHKAPFSKTVTLTYPFNPFNKVECRKFFHNEIGRPW